MRLSLRRAAHARPILRLLAVGATVGATAVAALLLVPPAYSARPNAALMRDLLIGEDTTGGVTVPAGAPERPDSVRTPEERTRDSLLALYPPPNPRDSTDPGLPDDGVDGGSGPGGPGGDGGAGGDGDGISIPDGSGLTSDQVVSATCRTIERAHEIAGQVAQAYEVAGQIKTLATLFTGAGAPVADPLANAAAHAWAYSARQGAKAEQWAAALGVGSMCNTSEIKRLTVAQFDFVRNVVNRGIESPLPRIDDVLDRLDSVVTPISSAVRVQRMERLFARAKYHPNSLTQSVADAAADSAIRAAEAASLAGDSMAVMAAAKIREFQEQLFLAPQMHQGRPACFGVSAEGDTTWIPIAPSQKYCPASPGRMQQLMAEEGNLTNAQLLHTNALQARRMELEYTRYQLEFRKNLITRSTALESARW